MAVVNDLKNSTVLTLKRYGKCTKSFWKNKTFTHSPLQIYETFVFVPVNFSISSITIILVFNWQTCYFFFNHKKWYFFLKPRKGCTFWHLKLEENILVSNILNTFFLFVLFFCEFIFFDCAKCLPNASCKNILNMIQTVVL